MSVSDVVHSSLAIVKHYNRDCCILLLLLLFVSGSSTDFAGSPLGQPGNVDGTGTNAAFNGLYDCQFSITGTIYATDIHNNKIRKITTTGSLICLYIVS